MTALSVIESKATHAMRDNGHSLLSPSGASKWVNCPASVMGLHDQRLAAPDNIASIEGTCAHYLLECCLNNTVKPTQYNGYGFDQLLPAEIAGWRDSIINNPVNSPDVKTAALTYSNYVLTHSYPDDMRLEVEKCYDVIMSFVAQGWRLISEGRVKLKAFIGHDQCDGTSDVILYKEGSIIVSDLKYGKGIAVYPEKNMQLMTYCAGALIHPKLKDLHITEARLVIMQPRINSNVWLEWSTTVAILMFWVNEVLRPASIKALKIIGDPESVCEADYNPSEGTCRWCARKGNCEAKKNHGLAIIQELFGADLLSSDLPVNSRPAQEVSDSHVQKVLDAAPFIKSWLTDYEKEAYLRTKKGSDVGRKLVRGRLSRKWPKSDAEMMSLFIAQTGVKKGSLVNVTLKSPPQIEKSDIDPDHKAKIMAHCNSTYGQDVLVLQSDSREASKDQVTNLFKQSDTGDK